MFKHSKWITPESNRWTETLKCTYCHFRSEKAVRGCKHWKKRKKTYQTQPCPMESLNGQPHHEQRASRNFPSSKLSSTIYHWITAQCQQSRAHDSPDSSRGPEKGESSPKEYCGGLWLSKAYLSRVTTGTTIPCTVGTPSSQQPKLPKPSLKM